MGMNQFIIQTITSYLNPSLLAPFFITNNISFTTKFQYDTSSHINDPWITLSRTQNNQLPISYFDELTIHNNYQSIFSSIVLTGVCIDWIGNFQTCIHFKNILPTTQFKHIKRIYCKSCSCTMVTIDITGLISYPKLKSITFPISHILNAEQLLNCHKLKTIDMSQCVGQNNFPKLKLKKFGFPYIEHSTTFPSKVKSLKMLSTQIKKCAHSNELYTQILLTNKKINMCALDTSSLRYLHLNTFSHNFINFPICEKVIKLTLEGDTSYPPLDVKIFPSVVHLVLLNLHPMYCMHLVPKFKSLQKLTFNYNSIHGYYRGHIIIESFKYIEECKNLNTLNICGIIDASVLGIIGRCYNLTHLTIDKILHYETNTCHTMQLRNLIKLKSLKIHNDCTGTEHHCFGNEHLELLEIDTTAARRITIQHKVNRVVLRNCPKLQTVWYKNEDTIFDVDKSGKFIEFIKK